MAAAVEGETQLPGATLSRIGKSFGAVTLFDGFDLSVRDGEFVVQPGKVIQSNVNITGTRELLVRHRKHRQFCLCAR